MKKPSNKNRLSLILEMNGQFKGELSRRQNHMIFVDNLKDLDELWTFKKNRASKACLERILEHFNFFDDVTPAILSASMHDLPMFSI